jgi:hypothetical protein
MAQEETSRQFILQRVKELAKHMYNKERERAIAELI